MQMKSESLKKLLTSSESNTPYIKNRQLYIFLKPALIVLFDYLKKWKRAGLSNFTFDKICEPGSKFLVTFDYRFYFKTFYNGT